MNYDLIYEVIMPTCRFSLGLAMLLLTAVLVIGIPAILTIFAHHVYVTEKHQFIRVLVAAVCIVLGIASFMIGLIMLQVAFLIVN